MVFRGNLFGLGVDLSETHTDETQVQKFVQAP